jgi:heptosyltransferase-2
VKVWSLESRVQSFELPFELSKSDNESSLFMSDSRLQTPDSRLAMKVMIRVPNWVGDAVMAEPALRRLRRIFKDARITFVARPWVAGLFEGENLYDDVIPAPDARGYLQSTTQFIKDARTLRREKFDYGVLLTNSFATAVMARAAGVAEVAGYATDWRTALLHKPITFEKGYKSKHQVFYYLNLALDIERSFGKATGDDLPNPQPQLQATAESLKNARRLFADEGFEVRSPESGAWSPASGLETPASEVGDSQADFINDETCTAERPAPDIRFYPLKSKSRTPDTGHRTKRLVALNPGATNSRAKQWLAERFAATADALAERDGFQTIIIGTAGDVGRANEVAQLMQTKVVNLAGRTSIAELKAVLSLSSLVISNDTGAAHVSAALGVPTVVVFGPTEHFATRPLSDLAAVVRHDVECSPCMLKDCPIDHRCMTRVEVDDVYAAAKRVLVMSDKR